MNDQFGLLGRILGHSWSKQIHAVLGITDYSYFEKEPEEVKDFIRNGAWKGINVTIPYKRQAFELADSTSARAQMVGVANTLIKRPDGSIYADNTDISGFIWLLEDFCARSFGCTAREIVGGKPVLVFGNGGASQAVQAGLSSFDADVHVVDLNGELNYHNALERVPDAVLIVHTTPVGMYPNCPAALYNAQELKALKALKGICDVVYNPLRTGMCLVAEELGIPYVCGLGMLCAQAKYASEQFQDKTLSDDVITDLIQRLTQSQENIVLIGMPGAGKTSTGKRLAKLLNRPFADLDVEFERTYELCPADVITQEGEDAFRAKESEVTAEVAKRSGLVIAAGGGGIPVIKGDAGYEGVAAVIDKDNTAALLAHDIAAERLVILTAVEKVAINFNKPNQKNLDTISLSEAENYCNEGQFAPGSMLPKIQACMNFVKTTPGASALITSLECAKAGLLGTTGTVITA